MDRSFVIGDYTFRVGNYSYGNSICIQVYTEYEPYCTLSVNLDCYGIKLKENEFVVNHDLLRNEKFLDMCIQSEYFESTGRSVDYGFCRDIPVWRLKGE